MLRPLLLITSLTPSSPREYETTTQIFNNIGETFSLNRKRTFQYVSILNVGPLMRGSFTI